MFSTTRRAIGVIGLTGSLVASFQLPGMVTDKDKPICHITKPFPVDMSSQFGSQSHSDTPLPLISTFTPFTIRVDDEEAGTVDSTKPLENPDPGLTISLPPSIQIEEETSSPHPLEVADASEKESKPAPDITPFVLSTMNVQKGDTLESIAKAKGINSELLKKLNPGRTSTLKAGETITIYSGKFATHKVEKGQSIWSIARKHNIKMSVLIYLNSMKTVRIHPGKELFIPKMVTAQSVKMASSVDWVRKLIEPPYHTLVAGKARLTSPFGWRKHPVTGKRGFHVGIDVAARKGTTIKAWKEGTVERACMLGLMGNCVIIRHSDGYASVYGHCSKLSVKTGQKVKAGEKIAEVGMTGRATGSHLHFAIKKSGRFLNPTKHLGT